MTHLKKKFLLNTHKISMNDRYYFSSDDEDDDDDD
jgi:hypothetical protein